jgi:hypothetical protein
MKFVLEMEMPDEVAERFRAMPDPRQDEARDRDPDKALAWAMVRAAEYVMLRCSFEFDEVVRGPGNSGLFTGTEGASFIVRKGE